MTFHEENSYRQNAIKCVSIDSIIYPGVKKQKQKKDSMSSPRTFGPLVVVSSKKKNASSQQQQQLLHDKDENRLIADMTSYPGPLDPHQEEEEEKQRKHQATNEMLRIDETAELLLVALKRNRQLGLQLSEKQKQLLKDVSQYLVFEEQDGVRKSKARMDFRELKEWDV